MSLLSRIETICPSPLRPVLHRVSASPIGRRIASGTFWSVLGNGMARAFGFLSMVLVARLLGKEAFGEFGLIRSTATTFVAFSTFGMGLTATKYTAELLSTDLERVGRIIGLNYLFTLFSSLLVASVFWISAPWLCQSALQSPHLVGMMRWGAVLLFLTTFCTTQQGILVGFQDFRGLALSTFLAGVLSLPIIVIATYYLGLPGAVIGSNATVLLNALINFWFVRSNTRRYHIKSLYRNVSKEMSILWASNFPLFLSGVTFFGGTWLAQLMLARHPNGISELSVYYAAFNYQVVMYFLPLHLRRVFFPVLSRLSGGENNVKFRKVVKSALGINFVASLIVALPFLLFPCFFMRLYGEGFSERWLVLIAAGISALVQSCSLVIYEAVKSRGAFWLDFILCLSGMAVYIGSSYYLLQAGFSAEVLFYALAISQFVFAIIALKYCFYRVR